MENISNKISVDEEFLHPNSLEIMKSNTTLYPSKFFIKDNLLNNVIIDKNFNKIPEQQIKNFMITPSIILTFDSILEIYNISSIDNLIEFINNNKDKTYEFINRVINCWIRKNFDDLKSYNKILISIYRNLYNKYYSDLEIDKKRCKKFISYWLKNKNISDFNLNLGNDLKKYLIKKNKI